MLQAVAGIPLHVLMVDGPSALLGAAAGIGLQATADNLPQIAGRRIDRVTKLDRDVAPGPRSFTPAPLLAAASRSSNGLPCT